MAPPLRPTPLEIACGRMVGGARDSDPFAEAGDRLAPLEAFERAVRAGLERPPCYVSFSGGRDSSAVLAVAGRIALREGLPPPLPITVRFVQAPGTDERRWQETVVRFLGLTDWIRLDVEDDLDVVGPLARDILRRHGVLFPPSAPLFQLMLAEALGGSLLVGSAGDRMLGGFRWRGDRARRLAFAATPRLLRREVLLRGVHTPSWLRPRAADELARAQSEYLSHEPVRFGRHLAWRAGSRASLATAATLSALGADSSTHVVDPFADPTFVAALARLGIDDRTAVMRAVFGDILPDDLLTRDTKAVYHHVYLRGPGREFARCWDGLGLDPELVDAEVLRDVWLSLVPDGHSLMPLQAAWLASAGRQLDHPLAGVWEKLPVAGAGELPSG